jgi:hypothetical protein
MNKIIVVSHNRTGTKSTQNFLQDLGFSVAHWGGHFIPTQEADLMTKEELYSNLIKLTSHLDVFMDVPFNHMYKELDLEYPGSKIILITRPTHEWVLSIRKIHRFFKQDDPTSFLQHLIDNYIENAPRSMSAISDEQLSHVHDSFIKDVFEYFDGRKDFLHLDLYDPEIGSKIKNFINPNLKDVKFPKIDFYGINQS